MTFGRPRVYFGAGPARLNLGATCTRLQQKKEHQTEDTTIELNAFVTDLSKLLSRTISTQVQITFGHAGSDTWIQFNITQLQQVVTNIVMNAVDAEW